LNVVAVLVSGLAHVLRFFFLADGERTDDVKNGLG